MHCGSTLRRCTVSAQSPRHNQHQPTHTRPHVIGAPKRGCTRGTRREGSPLEARHALSRSLTSADLTACPWCSAVTGTAWTTAEKAALNQLSIRQFGADPETGEPKTLMRLVLVLRAL